MENCNLAPGAQSDWGSQGAQKMGFPQAWWYSLGSVCTGTLFLLREQQQGGQALVTVVAAGAKVFHPQSFASTGMKQVDNQWNNTTWQKDKHNFAFFLFETGEGTQGLLHAR